ncbi:peptidylprolyl isomerase [uncultured Porphyromonas sp.]|jgi:putative peptidyl-prolyl cis-trans isomerase|uniref:peptidylprolyl isomerase n=1 Tax=uncultured Porphyromonas sp. TaxID=159274 RepID=UPI00260A16C6|nr:peptidylprolyl isomerase [uncultured Porphyromonas sp.]
MRCKTALSLLGLFSIGGILLAQPTQDEPQKRSIADQVVWMVGDEPILLSDIEYQKLILRSEGQGIEGDLDCIIPERIAIQKLFLNQAKIDSIEANETQVNRMVEMWIQNAISQLGSKEKLEEYFNKKISQIREEQAVQMRNEEIVRAMQQKIAQGIQVSPSEISTFYKSIPKDSLPFIPKTVEVEIIALQPQIPLTEIDRVKSVLRSYADDINEGKREFSTIARLYSEDKRTALQGGEYGFVGKVSLDPTFATAVFNLSDKTRVSPIIKTDEGYHIAQLIEKRGDLVNFRHILVRPVVDEAALSAATKRMDSITQLIEEGKLAFDQAAALYSEDKNTYNNGGLMINSSNESDFAGSSSFRYEDLPQDIAKIAHELKVGQVSKPFTMRTEKGLEQVAIIRLKEEHPEHIANMNTDFRTIKEMALAKKRSKVIDEWIRTKQKATHIYINEAYRNCTFQYPGWVHEEQ